jgi:large subunit ribosomal protein L29
MKANDLRERTVEDLRDLEKSVAKDVFQNRFKNFTNRLDDTSQISKARRQLARLKTILNQMARANASRSVTSTATSGEAK